MSRPAPRPVVQLCWVAVWVGITSCHDAKHFVVLTVDDPDGLTRAPGANAVSLLVGPNSSRVRRVSLNGLRLPLTIAIDVHGQLPPSIFVAAQSESGEDLARGSATLAATARQTVHARVRLGRPYAWEPLAPVFGVGSESVLRGDVAMAVDRRSSTAYVADYQRGEVHRVDLASGDMVTVVGAGVVGPESALRVGDLVGAYGVATDRFGNLYFANLLRHVVQRMDAATRQIEVVAGTLDTSGLAGDGGPATDALLTRPTAVALDGQGNLYIAAEATNCVRRVDVRTAVIRVVAGICSDREVRASGDGGPALEAQVPSPFAIALDRDDNLFISDTSERVVRRVDATTGIIETVAGSGTTGDTGDGGPATLAQFHRPEAIEVDDAANLFIADSEARRVRRVDAATGLITTLISEGAPGTVDGGGPAAEVRLLGLADIAVNDRGALFVLDPVASRILEVDAVSGTVLRTVASTKRPAPDDDAPATSARIAFPRGVSIDPAGNSYFIDTVSHRVRRVDAVTGFITSVAGSEAWGRSEDGGAALDAALEIPEDTAVDRVGNLYVSEPRLHRVRRVDASGRIETVAGNGSPGYSGDGGPATQALLFEPRALAVDDLGRLYIADTRNFRVRRVDVAAGTITSVAGNGMLGFAGDGGPATSAAMTTPAAIAVTGEGHLYIADQGNYRVRRVDSLTGVISTVVGTGVSGFSGDGGPALAARLGACWDVAVGATGELYIADVENFRIRRVDPATQTITTFAGGGSAPRDERLALDTTFGSTISLAVHPDGAVYFADAENHRVRKIETSERRVVAVAGEVDALGMGEQSRARLNDPRAMAWMNDTLLVAGGVSGTVQALRSLGAPGVLEVVVGRRRSSDPRYVDGVAMARVTGEDFGDVGGLAFDAQRSVLYLTESSKHRVLAVQIDDPNDEDQWTIAPLAGDGSEGDLDGAAGSARFSSPTGLWLDAASLVLYVADTGNHALRAIHLEPAPFVTTVTDQLVAPEAVTQCPNADRFVADTGAHAVVRIDTAGIVTTVLGDGVAASSGQGMPSSSFSVERPRGVACDSRGNLAVTSAGRVRMLVANARGVVDGAGHVYNLEVSPVVAARCLTAVSFVSDTELWVADSCSGTLARAARYEMGLP